MLFNMFFLSFLAFAQTLGTFLFSIFTMRILAPSSYGSVAYCWFYFSLWGALTDFGLENAFLTSGEEPRKAFWTHLCLRLFLASISLPLIFALTEPSWVAFFLFFDFLGQKLSFTPKLLAERKGALKVLSGAEALCGTLGAITTLILAKNNFGAVSIACGNAVRSWGNFMFHFLASRAPSPIWPSMETVKDFLLRFGFHGTFSSIIGLFTYDFAPFLVKTFAGIEQAGLYSRALSLAIFPLTLSGVYSRLSTKEYANNLNKKEILRHHLAKLSLFKILTIIPGQLILIIFAPQIFAKLFGSTWNKSVAIFRVLNIYTCLRLFYDDTTNVLSVGLATPKYLTQSQSIQTAIILTIPLAWIFFPKLASGLSAAVGVTIAMAATVIFFWSRINKELEFFSQKSIQFYKQSFAQFVAETKNKLSSPFFMNTQKTSDQKILFVSQFAQSSTNYCYADFFVKLANNSGLKTTELDCKYNYFRFGPKSSDLLYWPLRSICNTITNLKLIFTFARTRPSVLFLVKGENIWYRTLKFLKLFYKFKLVNFYPDSPFSFHNGNSNANVLNSLALYDRFAIWSKTLAQVLVASGCKEVFYWPFLCDKNIFKPIENQWQSDIEKKYFHSDVCFVGTWDKKRENFLTHLAKSVKNLNLKIWGQSWLSQVPTNSVLYPYLKGNELSPLQMSKAFCGSKIVLNFLKEQNLASHNMRTFEVVSTSAFLLTERSAAHTQELFTEDESVACFASKEELVEKIEKYLEETQMRFKIAQAGRERVEKITSNCKSLFQNLVSF